MRASFVYIKWCLHLMVEIKYAIKLQEILTQFMKKELRKIWGFVTRIIQIVFSNTISILATREIY